MAYTKGSWIDRVVQFPNRYKDQNLVEYTFTPDTGTVTAEGTIVDKAKMDNIENGVYNNDIAITDLLVKTNPSGFSQGLELDTTANKLRLFRRPQSIYSTVTANVSQPSVYNTSFEINLSGAYVDRFNRCAFITIKNTDNPNQQIFAMCSLGSDNTIVYINPNSPNYKVLKTTRGTQVLEGFSTNHGIGANVLVTNSTSEGNTFSWWINFDDSTKKITITLAGVGGFGTPHDIRFTADAVFI